MQKVSIIVPFFNVEPCIGYCLESLLNQTYTNIEILCIDDCSQDDSINIVDSYSKQDSRIKVIRHKNNKGLGGARNTGINNATGDFVCFVDSDDYVSNNGVRRRS